MQGFSVMLVEEAGAVMSELGRDQANRINQSAQFMDAMLRDLLAFSRVSQQSVELTAVDLGAVVESVVSRLRTDVQEKRADVQGPGPWRRVRAHEATLAQADYEQAKRELTGESDAERQDAILDRFPESERWDPVSGSPRHQAMESSSEEEDDEGRNESAPLVSREARFAR